MKKILMSLLVIAVAIGLVGAGVSGAWFSDTEQSTGNVMTAGIVDIEVDGENPWTATYSELLQDMKPCETRTIEFVIHNLNTSNPVHVWKHLTVISQTGGVKDYCTASSEPEYTEGGGEFWGSGTPKCTGYTERCNIASFIIYDLSVDGVMVIDESQQVRLDNVSCIWIYLGELGVDEKMAVVQSYHLMGWDDSGQEITNWAQGDVVNFDIELYAEQVSGPGPIASSGKLNLVEKDPVTWEVGGASGVVTYSFDSAQLTADFVGTVPVAGADYSLIYYPDPWPGNGGCKINTATAVDNNLTISSGTCTVPAAAGDKNMPAGIKLWVVLDSHHDGNKMTNWAPSSYLFDVHLLAIP